MTGVEEVFDSAAAVVRRGPVYLHGVIDVVVSSTALPGYYDYYPLYQIALVQLGTVGVPSETHGA